MRRSPALIAWCGPPGVPGHLSQQGCPQLRWASFEASRCAARRGSPDHAYYHRMAAKNNG
jgi:hypothetical protein